MSATKTICLLGSILCWNAPAQADGGQSNARKQTTVTKQLAAKHHTIYRKRFTSFPDEEAEKWKPYLPVDWGIGTPPVSYWWLKPEEIMDEMAKVYDSAWYKFKRWADQHPDMELKAREAPH